MAPTLFPIWTLPAVQGLFFVRAQNFVSVAGDDDRRDVNYLTLTPTLVHRLDSRRALLFDTEVVKDWERDGEVRWKSGLLFGSRLGARRAYWVKLEVPWGEHAPASGRSARRSRGGIGSAVERPRPRRRQDRDGRLRYGVARVTSTASASR